ncbi:hypothetical protein LSH36_923g00000 [Paralvinella palmiformis]|uniref:Uncharacterized protein n=1 Tax=Paralvinella palmiformis TaxID=53620 RepID=A0AAD9IXG7_9ANNE|nr:hypothetical protein LSH36_923g00000 [Paralvinella palmiformis]
MISRSHIMYLMLSAFILTIFLVEWKAKKDDALNVHEELSSNSEDYGIRNLHFTRGNMNFSLKKVDKGDGITATPNKLDTWIVPNVPDRLRNADQRDPELIRHIREFWIIPPFKGPISLQRHNKSFPVPGRDFSESGQPTVVNRLLSNKTKGFYVECGAADGEISSNSLFFELYHH